MRDIDGGNSIDWGKTSTDYSAWRPNYPIRFFQLLEQFGVGLANQNILDLGTGVGFLALQFAQAGAAVTGVDIAEGQIVEARKRAEALGVEAQLIVAPAEDTALPSHSFDAITASQCWMYFDAERVIAEVQRLLKQNGVLVTSHLSWLPGDPVAKASEQLVLQHNPRWAGAATDSEEVPLIPPWARGRFELGGMFVFDDDLPFTHESWRGRIRACRGIGATLSREEVDAFDRDHAALLRQIAPDPFHVRHRIDCHILKPVAA